MGEWMRSLLLFISMMITVFSQGYDFSKYEELLQTHVDDFGRVKYKALAQNFKDELKSEVDKARKYNPKDYPKLYQTKNDEFAYWINLYNHIVLNEVVQHYPIKSINDIPNVWKKKQTIGSLKLSLDEIEHEVLRKQFVEDPRFHFALICASYSCPKLQKFVYKGSKLSEQFNQISMEFYNNQLTFDLDKKNKAIYVSKIFDWYNTDFNVVSLKKEAFKDEEVYKKEVIKTYLIKNAPAEIGQFIEQHKRDIKVTLMEWHWRLNESVY